MYNSFSIYMLFNTHFQQLSTSRTFSSVLRREGSNNLIATRAASIDNYHKLGIFLSVSNLSTINLEHFSSLRPR